MPRKRIGELLLDRGVVTRAQLEEALAAQRTTRQRLGTTLVQNGVITEEELAQALGDALGIPLVSLRERTVEWSAVHTLRPRFCESNDLFPFALETGPRGRKQLRVAMADPLNLSAIEEIEFTTGLTVVPQVAPLSAIRAAILRYYHKVSPDQAQGAGLMTLVSRGGGARVVDTNVHAADEGPNPAEEEVIVGEELNDPTPRAGDPRRPGPSPGSITGDLEYLFGGHDETTAVEALERKFWALLRAMARKGLITKEEFTRELEAAENDPDPDRG